nr:hypothetical protein [uncultured Ruminobacter sp.]
MNDSTIRLSVDTYALSDSLSKIAEEMTAMQDAVSSSATAMGANLDASAKQAEATNAAIHGLDESVKTVTDSIEAQTKTVTDLGAKQSKITKEISKALETQNSQQKDANATLAEQKKIMQEQEAEIKNVTKAVDNHTGVLKKNASGWKILMTGFAIKFASEIVDGFKSIVSTGLEASRVYEDMSAEASSLLKTAEKGTTAAVTVLRICCSVRDAKTSSADCTGTTTAASPPSGAAFQGLSHEASSAVPGLLEKRFLRRPAFRHSVNC